MRITWITTKKILVKTKGWFKVKIWPMCRFFKCVKLTLGGSVTNRATLSSFEGAWKHSIFLSLSICDQWQIMLLLIMVRFLSHSSVWKGAWALVTWHLQHPWWRNLDYNWIRNTGWEEAFVIAWLIATLNISKVNPQVSSKGLLSNPICPQN